jgi:hypothetical protein
MIASSIAAAPTHDHAAEQPEWGPEGGVRPMLYIKRWRVLCGSSTRVPTTM